MLARQQPNPAVLALTCDDALGPKAEDLAVQQGKPRCDCRKGLVYPPCCRVHVASWRGDLADWLGRNKLVEGYKGEEEENKGRQRCAHRERRDLSLSPGPSRPINWLRTVLPCPAICFPPAATCARKRVRVTWPEPRVPSALARHGGAGVERERRKMMMQTNRLPDES